MSDAVKFVEQLVQETSPADDFPRLEMQEGGRPTLVGQKKFYENIRKAYNNLKKDLRRNPTQAELLRATGRKSQTAIRTAAKKFNLEFFNKPGEYMFLKRFYKK